MIPNRIDAGASCQRPVRNRQAYRVRGRHQRRAPRTVLMQAEISKFADTQPAAHTASTHTDLRHRHASKHATKPTCVGQIPCSGWFPASIDVSPTSPGESSARRAFSALVTARERILAFGCATEHSVARHRWCSASAGRGTCGPHEPLPYPNGSFAEPR
jgi:hypothetical protein